VDAARGGSVRRAFLVEKGDKAMSESIIIEIRAAEGGDDAKLLVREQRAIYGKLCVRREL
jgi:protein subunit release factor A